MTDVAAPGISPGPSALKRILVARDGSENAERAAEGRIIVAEERNATLAVVVVVPPSAYDEELRNGKEILAKAVETAKKRVVGDVSGVLRDGQAADEILKDATEQNVDLIVIGRRGLSGVERFLQGGVSSAVVSHSKCDTLVVK